MVVRLIQAGVAAALVVAVALMVLAATAAGTPSTPVRSMGFVQQGGQTSTVVPTAGSPIPTGSPPPTASAVIVNTADSTTTGTATTLDVGFAQSGTAAPAPSGTIVVPLADSAYPAPATATLTPATTASATALPASPTAAPSATLAPASPTTVTTTLTGTTTISQTALNQMAGGALSIWEYEGGLVVPEAGEVSVMTDTLLLPGLATNLQMLERSPLALGQFRLLKPAEVNECVQPVMQMPHIGETPDKLHVNLSIRTGNCSLSFLIGGTSYVSDTLRPAMMINGGSTQSVSATLKVLTGDLTGQTLEVPLTTLKHGIPLINGMVIEVTIPANSFASLDYAETANFKLEDVDNAPADAETRLFMSTAPLRSEPAQGNWDLDQWTYGATGLTTYQQQNSRALQGLPNSGEGVVLSHLALVGPTSEEYPYGADSCAWHTMTPQWGGFWFANEEARITNALCGSIALKGQGHYIVTGLAQENDRNFGSDKRIAFGVGGMGRYRMSLVKVDVAASLSQQKLVATEVITQTPWLDATTGRPQFKADWAGETWVMIEFDGPFLQLDIGPTADATSRDVRWPESDIEAPISANQAPIAAPSSSLLPPATTNRGPTVIEQGGR